jgi:hypothetical protein
MGNSVTYEVAGRDLQRLRFLREQGCAETQVERKAEGEFAL